MRAPKDSMYTSLSYKNLEISVELIFNIGVKIYQILAPDITSNSKISELAVTQ